MGARRFILKGAVYIIAFCTRLGWQLMNHGGPPCLGKLISNCLVGNLCTLLTTDQSIASYTRLGLQWMKV